MTENHHSPSSARNRPRLVEAKGGGMVFDTRLLTGAGVLAAVTEAGNFARAAEMLGLTPSGVSRAVARLEARVGVRLFDRNPREVRLTEEGRRFHAQVMPLLAGLDE